MATSPKPQAEPVLSLAALRKSLKPEPVMSLKFTMRLTKAEHEQLQRVSGAAGTTAAHTIRRLVAIAAEALLAEQEA